MNIKDEIISQLAGGDALIIVPPFASMIRPSMGVHLLQSCAREAGFKVEILYANLILAAEIGEELYEKICYSTTNSLTGERIFSSAAYEDRLVRMQSSTNYRFKPALSRLEAKAINWADTIIDAVLKFNYIVIGCTTTFEQTAASVALLNRIKRVRPDIVTIIGGSNCQGEMAEGITSLSSLIDYVFSGECETSFPRFLKNLIDGRRPCQKIIYGEPCANLNEIPTPNYNEFYRQIKPFISYFGTLVQWQNIWLPYESSRGCWWGQKCHCSFCGIDNRQIKFRKKSPERVINELKDLLGHHPNRNVNMLDNIMPYEYLRTLIPYFPKELHDVHIFYEQKANLSLVDVISLKKGGIGIIQPGIESLSTHCLYLMNKGVTARQNINLLRYARSVGLAVNWNLLYAIPGDKIKEYQKMLEMLPLLRHLHPPSGFWKIHIDRFSPYFENPDKFGLRNISPIKAYYEVLPKDGNISKIAYRHVANYHSESEMCPEIMKEIHKEIADWRERWEQKLPILTISKLENKKYLLLDTRGLPGTRIINYIDRDQAFLALLGVNNIDSREEINWALEMKLIFELDSRFVPLPIADQVTFNEFESESKTQE
jgi:ribosomal peptide maturation radical SAM protein 1